MQQYFEDMTNHLIWSNQMTQCPTTVEEGIQNEHDLDPECYYKVRHPDYSYTLYLVHAIVKEPM